MATRYPIRAVAKITGIAPETLRAWERRYGAVVPERSGRGRQYGEEQIRRLTRLNQLVQKGHAIGSIAALPDAALDALLDGPGVGSAPVPVTPQADRPSLVMSPPVSSAPVLSAIDDFDETRTSDELRRLAALMAPNEFLYRTVVPLMREVGTRWHDGRLAIAQEHLISQALRTLLGNMRRLFRPAVPARKMVFATPAGEAHEFGILAAAMLAATVGFEAVYLGVDLPADETARAARRVSAQVVVLGITIVKETTMAEVRAVALALPASTGLWLGGAGVANLDLSQVGRPVVAFTDLQAFEEECRRWRP